MLAADSGTKQEYEEAGRGMHCDVAKQLLI